ncbi:MAG: L,D-transpeptidase family protein [bacterium]
MSSLITSRHPNRSSALAPLALALVAVAALAPGAARAQAVGPLRPILGQPQTTVVQPEDSLIDIAYRFRLGYSAVEALNPGVDVWLPKPGTLIRLPTVMILPRTEPLGLVINVPEMRLYDFTVKGLPEVFAIAIGDEVDNSLMGEFKVGNKRTNPTWYVPASIRQEKPELPAQVPPGPDNPLGDRWMNIGVTSYGIHGTNTPYSIGRLATHGCVRLYNDEMRRLFDRTASGTRLKLVYQSIKLGRRGNGLYVEAYPDVYNREPNRLGELMMTLSELGLASYVDAELVQQVVKDGIGYPIQVGTVPQTVLDAADTPPKPIAPAVREPTRRKPAPARARPAARPAAPRRS